MQVWLAPGNKALFGRPFRDARGQLFNPVAPPVAPVAAAPAFAVTRVKETPVEPFTNTAMLELAVALVAASDSNVRSSNVAPTPSFSTSNAYPGLMGVTTVVTPV